MDVIRQIYKGRIVDVRIERVELPNGLTLDLEMVRHAEAAAVVALDDAGDVTLVHQFRHAVGGYIWEVPAGILDPGEEPAAGAARELREETGLAASTWFSLGAMLSTPGFCDEILHLYLATDLIAGEAQHERDEVIEVEKVSFGRALDMVQANEIQDGKSIAALHRAAVHLGILKKAIKS
jgi:8-oxo-dGTP pyrophosphatase MutT (NUDIX family)